MNFRSGLACRIGLFFLLLGLAGCIQLTKSFPEKQFYSLEVSRQGAVSSPAPGTILRVRRFLATPQIESRGLVYRTGELQYESDFYHEWFVAPSDLVTQQTQNWMAASSLFEHVLESASALEETHAIEGAITGLYGDYRDRTAPKAILEIRARLTGETASRSQIVFDQDYRQAITVPDESPGALVKAWNEELHQILTSLEADLRRSSALAKPRK